MNNSKLSFLAFTETQIVDAINKELRDSSSKIHVVSIHSLETLECYAVCETSRGTKLVVKFNTRFGYATIGIKSISKVKNKNRGWTMLFNGQPGKNLSSLVYNGEEGQLHTSSVSNLKKYMTDLFGLSFKSKIEDQVEFECSQNPALV